MQSGDAVAENPARGAALTRWLAVLPLLLGLAVTGQSTAAGEPIVAAASSLNGALQEISRAYTRATGSRVRFSFGSSGNLTRQIIQGAPFELFLSADEGYANTLMDRGLTSGGSEVYAVGRLVLFIPDGSTLTADSTLADLDHALADGRLKRLAMANPEHAPYGRAAREVLQHRHLWHRLQGRLLLGENVAQAARFSGSADVDAGLISASIALEPAMAGRGVHVALPESWHAPLEHHMVLLGNPGPVTHSFRTWLLGDEAQGVFRKFGFSTPARTQ